MKKIKIILLILVILFVYARGFIHGIRIACAAEEHERRQLLRGLGYSEEYSSK